MTPAKTTKRTYPVACAMIKNRHYKIELVKVTPRAQPTFALYRGFLIIHQASTAGECLAYLEEYLGERKIG